MKEFSLWVALIVFGFVLTNLQVKTETVAATQRLQMNGYKNIAVTEIIKVGAGLRTDCNFYEYARVKFNVQRDNTSLVETVSICISFFGRTTIRP